MRRPTLWLLLAIGLFLALAASAPSIHAADVSPSSATNALANHDHPASDGYLAALPSVLPGMDAPPQADKATVVDPRNPAWITHYNTTAGLKYFAPRRAPTQDVPQSPPISVGAWRNLFPGAGSVSVNSIADAPDGRVFVAIAGGGLLVYAAQNNGTYAWSTLTTGNSGIPSNNVTALLVQNGSLWAATSDAGLGQMDLTSGGWTTFNTGSGLPSNNITHIAENTVFFATELWLSTADNGISKLFQNNSGTTFTNYMAGTPVDDVAVQWRGSFPFHVHIWVETIGSIEDFDSTANTTAIYGAANTGNCHMAASTRAVVDNNNEVWFADWAFTTNAPQQPNTPQRPNAPANYYTNYVCHTADGSSWTWCSPSSPDGCAPVFPNATVSDMSVDYAGRVWMSFPGGGGTGGAAAYDQGTWWITTSVDGVMYSYDVNAVHAVGEDVWFGFNSSNGLSLYSPNWNSFVASQMGGSGQPTALRSDANLTLVGLGTGISWWDGSNWFNDALPGNSSAVTSFARSAAGVLWTGTAGNGLYNYNGSGYTQHTTADGLPSNTVRALLFDQHNKFWVATDAGLALRGNGYWDVFNQSTSGINSNDLHALAEDNRGRIWIGTGANGIDIFDPGALGSNPWKTETTANGLASNTVNALAEDPSGDIWAATSGGLGQWNHKTRTWSTWSSGTNVLSVTSDPAGRIWAGTTQGLAVIDAGVWKTYYVTGGMARSDKVVAVASDGNQTWEAGANTVAVRGLITGPIGNYPPTISDFNPGQGSPGATLTINGSNFDARGVAYNQVNFTGQYAGIYNEPAQVLSASASQLTVQVPALAYSGPFQVTSHHLNVVSSTPFTVAPAISSLSRTCIGLGEELDIEGNGFTAVSSYPYAYVKIGNGPWRVADAVDPTEIRQIIRPGDTAGTVSVALGSTSGPTVTSGTPISLMTVSPSTFAVQQGVQGEQMIWGKRTIVMVGLQVSATGTANCGALTGDGVENVDGGYLEWLKTDNTTYPDGGAIFATPSGLTVLNGFSQPLGLDSAVNFEMFNSYTWDYYQSVFPSMATFAGVRVHVTKGPIEVMSYVIPKSNFNFYDTGSALKMLMIHVYPTFMDNVQTNNQFLSDEYAGLVDAARAFPEQDAQALDGPNEWMVQARPVIGRDSPVDLSDTGLFGAYGQFGDLRGDGNQILTLANDPSNDLAQATTLIDKNLFPPGGQVIGKAMTSCVDPVSHCDAWVSAAFNYSTGGRQSAGNILQEAVHVSGWVADNSPNKSATNGMHSKYDENQTQSACYQDQTFRQALIDQLGYAGRVIRLAEDAAPSQFGMYGCTGPQMPKSIMSYAPNQWDNNVFLEPVDYTHELFNIWANYLCPAPPPSPYPPTCPAPPLRPAAATTYNQTWRFAGVIDASDHVTTTLAYLLGTNGRLTTPSAMGSFALRLLDAGQNELVNLPFSLAGFDSTYSEWRQFFQQHLGLPMGVGASGPGPGPFPDRLPDFNLRVPFPAGVASAQIQHNGHVIYTRAVPATSPSVNITAPTGGTFIEPSPITITWNVNNPGGSPLMYFLDYSKDNGSTWTSVSPVITSRVFAWKPELIPPSSQARVRVRASDGFHVVSAVSNVFTLKAQPPVAVVSSPAVDESFTEGRTIKLVGGSITPDGMNAGTFQWSHGNTVIGASRTVTFTLNHIGQQVFTFQVADAGLTATQRITVNVVPGFSNLGIPDSWLLQYKLNPLDPSVPFQDPDGDGLTNLQEYQFGTNPIVADTDGDSFSDGAEVAAGTDPLVPNQKPATTPVLHVGTNSLGWTTEPVGPAPTPWTIAVSNSGTGTVSWSISAPPPWLHVAPLSATAPTTVTFTALPQGLPIGTYNANLNVSAAGASGSPQTIHVTLNIIGFQIDLPVIRR